MLFIDPIEINITIIHVALGSNWSDLTLIEKRLKDIKKAELAIDKDAPSIQPLA